MSKITIEQIDAVRNRAYVEYKEAKEVLEKFDGDVVASILYLEEQHKTKTGKKERSDYYKKGQNIIQKLNSIRVKVYKKDDIILNMPSTIVIIFGIFGMHILIIGTLIGIFTGYKIKIDNLKEDEQKINDALDKVSTEANKMYEKAKEEIKKI